jgi:hypothetical protein
MLKKIVAAGVVGLATMAAHAGPINGAFSVSGAVTPLGSAQINTATGLDFTVTGANSCVGDIATIVGGNGATCNGATPAMLDLAAGTLNVGAFFLDNWISLSLGGVSFDLTGITEINRFAGSQFVPASIEIIGTGSMQATGWTNTDGGFRLTAQGTSGSFSFSGTQISASVPEPGTLALLGFALAGLAFTGRRKS